MKRICPALLALSLSAHLSHAAPTANSDSYTVPEDQVLTIPASGVLGNDTGAGVLSAVIESDVSNGMLTLNGDGSFSYTPDPNFNGTDTFTYRAVESPGPQEFTIDPARSSATIDATLTNSTLGSDDDSTSSRLQGTITALVTPSEAPFSEIHVTDFNVSIADDVKLEFRYIVFIFPAGVDVEADAGDISINMEQPGAASAVGAGGAFSQLQNEVRAQGTVTATGTGAASGQVPEGDQTFDETGFFVDLAGTITQAGGTLTLTTPFVFAGEFDLDENSTVDLDLDGTLVATSPVQTSELSAPTTVTITVFSSNDAPNLQDDYYIVGAGSSLIVPATIFGGGGDETLIDSGATWKYLDDGSDQGSAWREVGFDDAAWSSGPSQLGYGDFETTEIGFGGDENDKHVTSYFRHQFNVADPEAHGSLTLLLKRDDGAAVYFNGTEIVRSNLDAAASSATFAASTVDLVAEGHFYSYAVAASLLVDGTNTIAAEVHQTSAGSSDLIFDLQLIRHRTGGGVLANDSDIDGHPLSASVVTPPANGTLALAADGSFTYAPAGGFAGTDSFVYAAQDIDEFVEYDLISFGGDWKYLDDGSNQGTTWRDTIFDDSSWASGPGELGYGEDAGDQATVIGFGPNENSKFATTYFRNEFFLGNVAALPDDVSIRLVRDDAAAVYVNGTEIYRDSNLAAGAAFNAYASGGVADENEIVSTGVPKNLLVNGKNTIAVEVHQSSGTSSDLAFHLALHCETQSQTALLPFGSVWKYDDAGNDLGGAWSGTGFDDSLWLSGPGDLGYGDGDEVTELPTPDQPRPITVYFRHKMNIADASQVQTLAIDLVRDDGAAVYVNGTEVVRDNLVANAAFDTTAATSVSGDSETKVRPFNIDPSLLQDGENTIAVEVHQITDDSSDLSFDLQIRASLVQSVATAYIEVTGMPSIDSDNDGMADDWETANGLVVGIDDSALDPDGDGRSNVEEFIALTDPGDPLSLLKIVAIAQALDGDLTVMFSSTPGKSYQLQYSPDLSGFTDVGGATLTATGAESSFMTSSPDPNGGYYRVIVQ